MRFISAPDELFKSCASKSIMIFFMELLVLPIVLLGKLLIIVPITLISMCKQKKKCPPITDELLLIPANVLVKKISRREISCCSLLESYIKRVKLVNPLINAVVDERYSQALEDAQKYDNLIAKSSLTPQELEATYPLLGIPITVKESIGVNGMSNTSGSAYAKGRYANYDSDVVTAVKQAGAIIMLVSNTPELCLNWETSNNTIGTTCNPYDTRRTPGGSSGGEASLIGSGASLVGLGSDTAGSIRLPAHFCGIFSHKPTTDLVSIKGYFPDCTDVENWDKCFIFGPMARYASDLRTLVKLVIKPEMKESLKLDEEIPINKIKIYYMDRNGFILSSKIDSEIVNAIKKVTNYFETKYGFKINKVQLSSFKSALILSHLQLLTIKYIQDSHSDGIKRNAYLDLFKYIFCASKSTLNFILYSIINSIYLKVLPKFATKKIFNYNNKLREELEDILGNDGVLICPTFPTTAHYHGIIIAKSFDTGFMTPYSAFGMPVSSCPIGYDSKGLPIGIQVIAKRNCDRLTLAIAEEIEIACGGWNPNAFNTK